MRDVDNGYILRYTHANVASFFFIFVYAQFNFTNLFINLFNLFARCLTYGLSVLIYSGGAIEDSSASRMIGSRALPNHHCNMSGGASAALNVKEEGNFNIKKESGAGSSSGFQEGNQNNSYKDKEDFLQ
jgi:hypothetical protein